MELFEYMLEIEVPVCVQDVYNLLEMRVPKKNCTKIASPPSAERNCFYYVVSFYINRGTIHNFSRYSNVPLQDAVDKRVLLWNETNCESRAFKMTKNIFDGDVDNVAFEYSPDMTVTRTPVIVLNNNATFLRDAVFNHRMFRYRWRTCLGMSQYSEMVHPHVLLKLFDVYLDDEEYIVARVIGK